MLGNGRFAARATLAASAAGLVMITAAPALAAAGPPAAGRPPALAGAYQRWSSAQRAAGFRLRVPTKTFGLVRTHPILVGRCEVTGKLRKHDVYAEWDGSHRRYLVLDQNNSGGACSNFGAARPLGRYRIQGHRARMYGFCGVMGLPRCTSRAIVLVLAWRAGRNYYVAYSGNEWRRTLVAFARSLRRL